MSICSAVFADDVANARMMNRVWVVQAARRVAVCAIRANGRFSASILASNRKVRVELAYSSFGGGLGRELGTFFGMSERRRRMGFLGVVEEGDGVFARVLVRMWG